MILAQDGGAGGASFMPILMIGLLFGVMYFMMIRPQQKRRKEAEQMQSSIGPGDEVVTIGGLYGTVASIDDETVMLEVSPGVHERYARPAIARVVPKTDDTIAAESTVPDEVPTKD
ncbi:preprotein translocase subunit YajC [Micromonospora sp. LOL_023]|uniref:preprotein translocase subunit YajC n=1 Tax=Micromonospora sp. LOL_023 TaxID=3345418 RepID=UPI003A8B7839